MKGIFTLVGILVSSFGLFSQPFYALEKKSPDTLLTKMLQGRLGCGIYTAQRPKVEPQRIVIRCGLASTYATPLLIVNGISQELTTMQTINPYEIECIQILKEAAAIALYGPRASSGIILITTKSSPFRQFSIKDSLDGSKIAGATVTFSSANDKRVYVADENGLVITDILKAGEPYKVNVSAVGYNEYSMQFKNPNVRSQEILLKRDVKTCGAAVVVSYVTVRCRCCRETICSWSKKAETLVSPASQENISSVIYPNPVQKANTVTIETITNVDKALLVKITDLSGKLLLSQSQKTFKGNIRFLINTDSRWAPGIYIVQLLDEKGKLLRLEKLLIQ